MKHVFFIRHGRTEGNQTHRYIGRTDETLSEPGIKMLKKGLLAGIYPIPDRLFVSPMKRCLETANLLYPQITGTVIEDLRELDFGIFENKNAEELADCPDYQNWVDSGGLLPIPGGESRECFLARSVKGFQEAISQAGDAEQIGFVVHGGTIMSLLSSLSVPESSYYDWIVKNGDVIYCNYEEDRLHVLEWLHA